MDYKTLIASQKNQPRKAEYKLGDLRQKTSDFDPRENAICRFVFLTSCSTIREGFLPHDKISSLMGGASLTAVMDGK
jgi:hypothetical protein